MSKEPLISFHGRREVKDFYIERVKAHAIADEIIQGTYWDDGKGCAVGCTIHGSDHSKFEKEIGVPRIIAMLEDKIFEGLPNAEAKKFPLQFLNAIPVGKNLDPVWRKFFVWLLVDETEGVIKHAKKEETKEAIRNVANLLTKSLEQEISADEFNVVRKAAASAAAYAVADAASADAYAVADAASAYAAAVAAADAYADADAYAAADAYADADAYAAAAAAAYAYADAAAAAYAYADAAAAYAVVAYAARKRKYMKMRDKLIELLAAA